MGGGRQEFLPTYEKDIEGVSGKRTDSHNLIKHWRQRHHKRKASYVQTKEELLNVNIFHTKLYEFLIIFLNKKISGRKGYRLPSGFI